MEGEGWERCRERDGKDVGRGMGKMEGDRWESGQETGLTLNYNICFSLVHLGLLWKGEDNGGHRNLQ